MPFFGVPIRNGVPIGLGSIAGFGIAPFDPSELFAAGEQGVWYDPSDFTTMFQDDAGTIPVTAVGQSVGLIRDKSGRNNNASQATPAARPILGQEIGGQYYLAFGGSVSLATNSINFSATDKMSVFAGAQKLSDVAAGIMVELSASMITNAGAFRIDAPSSAGANNYRFLSRGSGGSTAVATKSAAPSPDTCVLSGLADIAADTCIIRYDGVQAGTSSTDQGSGNYGDYPLYIGRRGGATTPFIGRIYSLIVCGATVSASQVASTEAYVNAKTGAY